MRKYMFVNVCRGEGLNVGVGVTFFGLLYGKFLFPPPWFSLTPLNSKIALHFHVKIQFGLYNPNFVWGGGGGVWK
jgi:hypothetical protein